MRSIADIAFGGIFHIRIRQNRPVSGKRPSRRIASDPTLEEVILSGGDPLTLVDQQLEYLLDGLKPIAHVKRLRIHTRLPIMIPQRITQRLTEILTDHPFQSIVVIHCNHANELDDSVKLAIEKLSSAGVTMLNQTVLLRGVNDRAEALIELSRRLLDLRVMPYYLHQLDPVVGTAHFEVPKTEGLKLIEQMRAALPGVRRPAIREGACRPAQQDGLGLIGGGRQIVIGCLGRQKK